MVNRINTELSEEEREVARVLWQELVMSSPDEAKDAQRQLCEAPPAIQQALIDAIVRGLHSQQELHSLPNPFVVEE